MSERKALGKIKTVTFGHGGYQGCCIGINFELGGEHWGVGAGMTAWDANLIKHTEHCKWTEADRNQEYVDIMRYVSDLLRDAKVSDIAKLQGIPIEATFDGNMLKGWRVLKEVL